MGLTTEKRGVEEMEKRILELNPHLRSRQWRPECTQERGGKVQKGRLWCFKRQ